MSCRHCGASLPDGAMLCGECGRSVSSAVTSASSTARRPAAPVPVVLPRATPPVSGDAPGESADSGDATASAGGDAAGDTARIDPAALAGLRRAAASAEAGAAPDAAAPHQRSVDSIPDAVVGSAPEILVEPRRPYENRARPELAEHVEPGAEPGRHEPAAEPPRVERDPEPASPGPDLPVDLERTRVTRPAEGPTRFVLQFSTGESISVTGSGLVGRNPSAEPGEFVDHLVTVFDAGKSVSKAHLEFGQESGRFWVSDRFSTNGTVIRPAEQEPRRCEPGRRYFVDRGTRVDVGEQFFVVS